MKNLIILVFIIFSIPFLSLKNLKKEKEFQFEEANQFLVNQFSKKDIIFLGEVTELRNMRSLSVI